MIQIRKLDHIVLRVVDVEKMFGFYRDVLGCEIARRNEELGLIHLRAGDALIDLVDLEGKIGRAGGAAPGKEARNMDHFCLRIEPFDEAQLRSHLESHGVSVGPVEKRFGAEGEGPSIYITDPEGNMIEFKGPPNAGQ